MGIQTGKGLSGRRDGRSEGCWVEDGGAVRGWILALQGMERPPSRDSLTSQPVWALQPPSRVMGERLWGPAWELGTAGGKTSLRLYLHLIYI